MFVINSISYDTHTLHSSVKEISKEKDDVDSVHYIFYIKLQKTVSLKFPLRKLKQVELKLLRKDAAGVDSVDDAYIYLFFNFSRSKTESR